jgi:hypothetical protein
MRADAGRDIACPRCFQLVKLPGRLAAIATCRRARKNDPRGIAMELSGLALFFIYFPWGMIVGSGLAWLGWRRCGIWVCDNCETPLPSRDAESCPGCRSKFGSN